MSKQPILIVEDEPDGQVVVAGILNMVNAEHDVAYNGEDAWVMLQSTPYAAVIIDLALPGIDGIELLQRIRGHEHLAGLPCIAVTAYHTPELKQRAIAEGFNSYFPKPINRTLFLLALDNLQQRV